MKIAAIETRYAGCRFRSRLEARCAVFFDHFGVRWEYEKQGFECTARLTLDEEPIPYLPDFWFPDLHLFGEVKGSLDNEALTRLLNVAASLSSNDGGGCHDQGGSDLVVFGEIPRSFEHGTRVPTRLHMHKGDLQWSPWTGQSGIGCDRSGTTIAADLGGDIYDYGLTPEAISRELLSGSWSQPASAAMKAAYTAARSARFEHGESGA